MFKPIKIGSLQLRSNIVYSPLAGCSDFPTRFIAQVFKPGLLFCEMVKMDGLIRGCHDTFRILDFDKTMHPIGAQICGNSPKKAMESARMIEDMGFDLIDFNCGCPVDKVTKDKSGSYLLKYPDLIGEILAAIGSVVKIPVTIKIRSGWDSTMINAAKITKVAELAGAKAVFIHGRTRKQGYRGPAIWDYIKEASAIDRKIIIFGNGDVFCPRSAQDMISYTGCDGVLVSRGYLGSPWIASEIEDYKSGKLGSIDIKAVFLEHLEVIYNYRSHFKSLSDMRKIAAWYLRKLPNTEELRKAINKASSIKEVIPLIEKATFIQGSYPAHKLEVHRKVELETVKG